MLLLISIHAPREGSDLSNSRGIFHSSNFNPRSPRGERQLLISRGYSYIFDFNPRSPRGERHCPPANHAGGKTISIHAPREGSDDNLFFEPFLSLISIHAPREGSDTVSSADRTSYRHFNPRSPRGERQKKLTLLVPRFSISIHAPREGSDGKNEGCGERKGDFNPRSPRGERRQYWTITQEEADFNPRSPRGERLSASAKRPTDYIHFNPRSPRGERRQIVHRIRQSWRFQSTLPARGATRRAEITSDMRRISIHAPREGSDLTPTTTTAKTTNFNPRSPRGERLSSKIPGPGYSHFNPRSPRGERHRGRRH